MSSTPQLKLGSKRGNSVQCLISIPKIDAFAMPAVAVNLDRHGAVVHLDDASRIGDLLVPLSAVEVHIGLRPNGSGYPRLLHCLGQVVRQSKDHSHRLWLVLRFSQIFVTSQEGEVSGESNAPVSDVRRGDCDPTITEERQLGVPPKPSLITKGE